MRVIVLRVGDAKLYPPTISLMNIISALGHECIFITTKDSQGVELTLNAEVKTDYIEYNYDENKSLLGKAIDRSKIENKLWSKVDEYYHGDSILWVMSDVTIKHLGYKLLNYRYVLHMDELNDGIYYTSKFKQFKLDATRLGNGAHAVVVPEYNRAHITKTWWGLNKLPYILPNKPYMLKGRGNSNRLTDQAKSVIDKLKDKKIVLYQGGLGKERSIHKFVEAVQELDEFAFVIMSGDYSEYANKGYKNCFFIDYMTPPVHLLVTERAYIGIVTYIPVPGQNSVLNALYCAPNKMYEYSCYGVPIIGNDIPGIRFIVNQYNNGIIIDKTDKNEIIKAITSIDSNYEYYSKGATSYYTETDNRGTVESILNKGGKR